MAIDPKFHPLLQSLKLDDPFTPPKTWESIPSQSGDGAGEVQSRSARGSIYELPEISEAALVRLVINALLGVKSSLMEIDKLSAEFCSSAADRTSHRIPSLWSRATSTNSLGRILRDISRSGLVVFFLQRFVDFYLSPSRDVKKRNENKEDDISSHNDSKFSNDCNGALDIDEPPYSLVNQSFAVTVRKLQQGYFGALNTLLASVRLRRSTKKLDSPAHNSDEAGCLTRIVQSETTFLEVYLHTKELRTYIESLGAICFPKFADLDLSRVDLTTETELNFDNFPKGADLLSYLYVQLRDADPVHRHLLKILFVGACEPYCDFIKSWIYRASINDPYREFFVYCSTKSSNGTNPADEFSLTETKERSGITVPCFLQDVRRPILRTGQQLQVLVKLLSLCNIAVIRGQLSTSCRFTNFEEILPCWINASSNSDLLLTSITFCKRKIEALLCNRQTMYQGMLEKLEGFLSRLDVRWQKASTSVFAFSGAPDSLLSAVDFLFSCNGDEVEATKINASQSDSDAAYGSDDSTFDESSNNSEHSSSYDSDDDIEHERIALQDTKSKTEFLLLSNLSKSNCSKGLALKSTESEIPYLQASSSLGNLRISGPLTDHCGHEGEKLNDSIVPLSSVETGLFACGISRNQVYQFDRCWPVAGLLKNPFHEDGTTSLNQPFSINYGLLTTNRSLGVSESTKSASSEILAPLSTQLMDTKAGSCMSSFSEACNSNKYCNFNVNPILTRPSCVSKIDDFKGTGPILNCGKISYFDFAVVSNPCNSYLEKMPPKPDYEMQIKFSTRVNGNPSDLSKSGVPDEASKDCIVKESTSVPIYSSRETYSMTEEMPSISGGASWVRSLKYNGKGNEFSDGVLRDDAMQLFDMPLDVVIDKCILQEISLQYNYVSKFTIKLLGEAFDLHEHLLALRRYHLMELADWADSFIISIRNQKWSIAEADKKIAEIQGFLEMSLQRSSCETDQYRENLFVYTKGCNNAPAATSPTGQHIFGNVLLGYKVEWPINLILTPSALDIYAEIFSFLVQVKLAAFALNDIWLFLKPLMYQIYHGQHRSSPELKDLKMLVKLRQQINHFVSALQQYLFSQLSGVSWSHFQHSLKYQVKDILDLEFVHMSYLGEAKHICFLSDEMNKIGNVIENVLQCALDFSPCFLRVDSSAEADIKGFKSQINFCKVFTIKATFDRNLKDLYILHLKSPNHDEFALSRFWGHLNCNGFFSNMFNKDIGCFYG